MSEDQFIYNWRDSGIEPKVAPNPEYPHGKAVDVSGGAAVTCTATLPYPAKRIGAHFITCRICGSVAACTTAGRPDDPSSIKMRCDITRLAAESQPPTAPPPAD